MPSPDSFSDEPLAPQDCEALEAASHVAGAIRVPVDVDAAFHRYSARVDAAAAADLAARRSGSHRATPFSRRRPLAQPWHLGAFAALGLAAIIVVGRQLSKRAPSVTPSQTYVTRTGERASVQLPNGGRMLLAPRTTAVLSSDPSGTRVTLAGEAYFEVASAARVPFIIRAGAVTTRVLGTRFDVRHYEDDATSRVVVQSGKVALEGGRDRQPLTLAAGMVAQFTDTGIGHVQRVTDSVAYVGWTHGVLDFTDTPVPEVLSEMGRWYGYRFQLADTTLLHRRITATFDYQSRADLFQALETLLSVSVSLDHAGADTVVVLRWHPRDHRAGTLRKTPLTTLSNTTEVGR